MSKKAGRHILGLPQVTEKEEPVIFDQPLTHPKTGEPLTDEQLKGITALGDKLIELDEKAAAKKARPKKLDS